jgi:formamidopyrimidine-DNA glycosylase
MPELPEVETVRDGLGRHLVGRTITGVEVRRDSAVRRHDGGPDDFAARLIGRTPRAAVRRGKYLWLLLDDSAMLAHLGMSGQLLVRSSGDEGAESPHLRVRFQLDDDGRLDFVDQRTFGHLAVRPLVPTPDGAPGGHGALDPFVPDLVAHIARDLLDPNIDRDALVASIRRRRTGIKRALLDQGLVSGIGNIYADEALWQARLHYARPTDTLRRSEVERVLDSAAEVMRAALAAGGTSFDALYVNVNGTSGYFDRSLDVYGQQGRSCRRCGTPIRRDTFMNRSAHLCPHCQPRPRHGRY